MLDHAEGERAQQPGDEEVERRRIPTHGGGGNGRESGEDREDQQQLWQVQLWSHDGCSTRPGERGEKRRPTTGAHDCVVLATSSRQTELQDPS